MSAALDLTAATVELRDDGIVEFSYKPVHVDLPAARELLARTREALRDDVRPRPTLVIIGRASVDREAREYFACSDDNRALASRVAMVATNPLSRVIGNFFLGLNRPGVPTRLFGEVDAAVAWLLAP
jgi:hypothetical protein